MLNDASAHERYARLTQRFLSFLQMPLREGRLYQIDTRLRPSGNQGALVIGVEGFIRYHTGAAVPAGPADVKRFVASDFADASVLIGQAPAWRGIVQAAVDEKADVVAVARQGADNIGEEILGTTTDRVLRHAPCPVLVA